MQIVLKGRSFQKFSFSDLNYSSFVPRGIYDLQLHICNVIKFKQNPHQIIFLQYFRHLMERESLCTWYLTMRKWRTAHVNRGLFTHVTASCRLVFIVGANRKGQIKLRISQILFSVSVIFVGFHIDYL
jgi:hypothetical protein